MRFLVALSALALALAPGGQAAPLRESRQLGRRDNNGANRGPLIGEPGILVNVPRPLQGGVPGRGLQDGRRLARRALASRQIGGGPGNRGPLIGGPDGLVRVPRDLQPPGGGPQLPQPGGGPRGPQAVGPVGGPQGGPVNKLAPRGIFDLLNLADLPADAAQLLMTEALNTALAATQAILMSSADNDDLTIAGEEAQAALETANASIANIQSDIAAGNEPSTADRDAAEQGLLQAEAAINQLEAVAGPNPDENVSLAIDNAKGAIGDAVAGGKEVLGI